MSAGIRMAIVRPIALPISRNFYNSQEIGLARGLSRCGIDADVYVAGGGGTVGLSEVETAGPGRVRLFELPFLKIPLIDQAFYPKLTALLDEGNYDFIQVNEENELTSLRVARYAFRRGIPVVVYQGMYKPLTGRIYAAYQKTYDRLLLPHLRRYLDLALVKTTRAGNHLRGKGFRDIEVLPVGVDPVPFAVTCDRQWRRQYGIPAGSSIILYVGVFEKRRNVDFMLDMARELAADGVTLLMAGGGVEYERIAARIANEGLDNVRLLGSVRQSELPSLYRESSLFLLPSDYEIYGMVVLEAMYFGLPVISTRTAGPEDIIEDGVDGFLMERLDLGEWTSLVRTFCASGSRNKMGEAARHKVHSGLTWSRVAQRYAVIIDELRRRRHGGQAAPAAAANPPASPRRPQETEATR